ncbi:porin family protein [Pseudoflavitalea rhizosphaerae]|uniref:porin family protein n=1 Tax=Pseudoflavitalea rhizosphaerae TaxID=1884793 RepID=UPI000F8E897B|nr:porin family protein [Pseudoflavitalea rhizosphaerae]
MKRKYISIILMPALLLLCRHSVGQWSAGVSAGFTLNQPGRAPGQAYSKYLPAGGFALGIPVQYNLTEHWGLRAEPGLLQKNISFERTNNYSGTWEKRYNNYLQLPLMLQYRTGGDHKFSGFMQTGLYAGSWISGRQQGAVPDIYDLIDEPDPGGGSTSYFRIKTYNHKYEFDSEKDQRIDWGAVAGIGLNYQFNSQVHFYLELRYSQPFTSYEKEPITGQQKPVHQTAAAMLGCLMNLFNRK